jgi:hypothetical protein
MPTLVGAAVCLALRFEWNGQVLQAGRRPASGVEVPSVKRQPEPPGTRESILYPLSPASFRHLSELTAAGQPLAVVLEPALPSTPGDLRVRLSFVACPGAATVPAPPGAKPAEFKVSALLPVMEGPGAGSQRATVASGVLSEAAPLDLTLHFPREAGPEEEVQLIVASATEPERRVVFSWSRSRHPGQERFVWREPPPDGAGRRDPGGTMIDPSAQQGWRDYKATWELAGNATSGPPLYRLIQQVQPFEGCLDGLVDAPLKADLAALVRTRAKHRYTAVAPARDEPPGPDHAAELRELTADLERSLRVIERLRQLGWKDPWIETGLARHAAFILEVVASEAERVELVEGRATDQVLEARALIARVRPGLPRPPK